MTYVVIFISLIFSAQFYYILAKKYNIIDNPNERSSHVTPTVRGGGIIFLFSILLYSFTFNYQYPYLITGIIVIAAISFIDDLITLGFKIRLAIQFISIALILYQLQDYIPNSYYLIAILTVVCVGIINIYNFMDGINGITGLVSLSTLLGFLAINSISPIINQEFIIFPIISILIFGFYNFRKKALFFAGDVGSISMAIIILFLSLYFYFKLNSPIILLLLSVYMVDGGLTILRRLLKKENIFKPHKSHLYQRLTQKTNLSHLRVSLYYSVIQLLLIVPIIGLIKTDFNTQLFSLSFFVIMLSVIHTYIYKKIS